MEFFQGGKEFFFSGICPSPSAEECSQTIKGARFAECSSPEKTVNSRLLDWVFRIQGGAKSSAMNRGEKLIERKNKREKKKRFFKSNDVFI